MAGYLYGEKEMPFVKGSSRPKNEVDTLESKLFSLITTQLVFKDGSKVLDVTAVSQIKNVIIRKGDYLLSTNESFNHEFNCDVQLCIKVENGFNTEPKRIRGYFQSDDEKEINIFNEVQIIAYG